jgi:predicted enzyme related to lactoylglutathione lyase
LDASAFLPDGAAAYWRVYFGVDDTDAVAAQVVDLGGSVLRAAEDTPYGRIAEVADPTGVQFSLLKP